MPLNHAMDKIRLAQQTVHINPGFEAQLVLYQDMGCRLPDRNDGEARALLGTAEPARQNLTSLRSLRADATYRWFLFARGVNNGDKRYPKHIVLQSNGIPDNTYLGGEQGKIASGHGTFFSPKRCRGSIPKQKTQEKSVMKASYRCKACRSPLFYDTNIIDHLHPIVLAVSDSTYASFSRHGDGSSWLAARDAASAAAMAASIAGTPSKAVRGKKSRPEQNVHRGGGVPNNKGSTGNVDSASARGPCTSLFTEVLGWVCTAGGNSSSAGGFLDDSFRKITCPGMKGTGGLAVCGSKLGSWSLDGSTCSCGRIVKPAVQFTLSRIECVQTI